MSYHDLIIELIYGQANYGPGDLYPLLMVVPYYTDLDYILKTLNNKGYNISSLDTWLLTEGDHLKYDFFHTHKHNIMFILFPNWELDKSHGFINWIEDLSGKLKDTIC